MSKAEEFRQYAEEAMRWAYQSKTEKDKQALWSILRAHGRKLRCRASAFWSSTAVRQRPGPRKAVSTAFKRRGHEN
jgi:hypothetical protein